jgi:hypothetical protein
MARLRGGAASLVGALGAPVAWALHFLASYALVGLACAAGWERADVGLALLTAACLAAALASGVVAYRRWRSAADNGGWEREVMLAGVLGTVLFTLAIALEAAAPVFLPLCPV